MTRGPSLHTEPLLHPSPEPFHGESGELKGCPFCGNAPEFLSDGIGALIQCRTSMCPLEDHLIEADSGERAKQIWNARSPDPQSAVVIGKLERELDSKRWTIELFENNARIQARLLAEVGERALAAEASSAAEIERLRRENDELRAADRDHLSATRGMEKRLTERALTAESLLAAAWENAAKIAEGTPTSMSVFLSREEAQAATDTKIWIAAALRAASLENVSERNSTQKAVTPLQQEKGD